MSLEKDQDLKKYFHKVQLPEVDLTGKVMSKLYAEQKTKERFFVKYRTSMLVLTGMLLTVSSTFAATNYFTLKNGQGEVVYEEKAWGESNPDYEVPSLDEQLRSLKSVGYSNELLKEGEAAIFYVVPHNPDNKLDIEYQPLPFNDLSKLRDKMEEQPAKLFDQLAGNYKFEHATVFFFPSVFVDPLTPKEEKAIAKKLQKQAEESGKDYAMMPIEVSNDYWRILSTYKQDHHEIRVTMAKTPGKQTVLVPEVFDFKREPLEVKGVEMFYTEFDTGRNIQWVHDIPNSKEAVHYHIETGFQISKEELIELAQSYLK